MKKIYSKTFLYCFKSIILNCAILILFTTNSDAQTFTQTFVYTGSVQTWTVPSCVANITLDVRGAQGANAIDVQPNNASGGLGGRSLGVLTVTPGQVLNIFVGGAGNTNGNGGFNGGGAGGLSSAGSSCNGGFAGGGGGGSDIRTAGVALTDRIIVAGGGGGSGRDYCNGTCQPCGCGGSGGHGGGTNGANGIAGNNCGYGYPGTGTNFGSGGGQTSGGSAGQEGTGNIGSSGVLGVGGAGATGAYDVAGGGGGGGYYGGAGGTGASSGSGVGGGGGGGGSGYITGLLSGVTSQSFQSNNGSVILTYGVTGGVVSATSNSNVICFGSSIQLNASSGLTSYTWSNNSPNTSITVSPTVTTTYTISATNSVNCVSSAVITITVSPGQPTISIVTSTPQTCLGKTATLTASGALTYTWSNNVTNGVSFNPSVTTVYTVSGQNGCGITTATTSIAVAPIAIQVSNTPTITCAGQGVSLTAVAAATNYTWLPGTNLNASLAVVAPTVTTVYTISVSDGTCSGVSNITLSPNPVPTIVATTAASQVCVGDPIVLNASGGLSYIWNPGNLAGASVTVTPLAPTLYSVVGLNSFSCSGTANQVILTNAAPVLNLSASTQFICPGDPVTLTVNGNAISYTWTNNNSNLLSITDNPMVSTTYTVVGESIVPCYTTQTINVDVFNPPIIISGNTLVCEGTPVTLTGSGADTYLWNNTFPNPYTFTANASSTQSLSTTTSSNGLSCSKNLTVQVQVNPNPTVTAGATKLSMCVKENNVITASGASTYSWSSGQSTSSFAINPQVTGISFYTVTGVGTNGCSAKKSFQVQVNACAGLSENNFENGKIKVFPNPSSGTFNIQSQYAMDLNLSNELGQNIREIKLNEANNFKAEIKNLASGIYFISNDQKRNQLEGIGERELDSF